MLLTACGSLQRELETLPEVRAVGEIGELVVVRLLVDPLDLRPDPTRDPGKQGHEDGEQHEKEALEHPADPEQRALRVPLDRVVRLDDGRGATPAGCADRRERLEHLRPRERARRTPVRGPADDDPVRCFCRKWALAGAPDELVVRRVGHQAVAADERDTERVVRDEMQPEQVVELALARRGDSAGEVVGFHLRAEHGLCDEARLLRRSLLGLSHRETAHDDEDQRRGEGERDREDDGEAQDETRRPFDREQSLRVRAATCEWHQRFGLPRIGPRRSSSVCCTVPAGSSIT